MLQTHSSRWTVALLAFGALIGWSTTAAAEVPDAITHQGRLLDSNGEPVTGTTQMTFTLYDSETGGAVLWEGQAEVEVGDSGFYSVELGGSNNPIDSQVLQGGNAWLGVAVEGGEEMSPRLKLNTSPYAQVASRAESVADGSVEESSLSSDLQTKVDEASSNPQWDDLQNVPEGLDDGDDDTLGGLNCQPGYVAKATQSGWTCQEDETNTDWNDLNNVPSDIADGDDTLDQLGMNCQTGYVPKWDGSSWTCQPDQNTNDWNELNNVPSDIADGDQDTLGGISCQSGQVAEYDGSNWTCVDRSTYSDSDAVQAVANDDSYVQNSGDSMSGTLQMNGNRVRGLGAPTRDNDATTKEYVDQEITTAKSNLKSELFWTAAVSLDNQTYKDEDGNTETLNRIPSSGQTECSSGQSVCVYNDNGQQYRISILIPDSIPSGNNAPDFGNIKCWATAPGDNDSGNHSFQAEVDSYATDVNGGHQHCNVSNSITSSAGGEQCISITTTGTYRSSHTTYGVVCLNL